jgi:hypothetical protein
MQNLRQLSKEEERRYLEYLKKIPNEKKGMFWNQTCGHSTCEACTDPDCHIRRKDFYFEAFKKAVDDFVSKYK